MNCELCARARASDFRDVFWAQPTLIVEVIEFMHDTMKKTNWSLDERLANAHRFFTEVNANIVKATFLKNMMKAETEAFKALKSLFSFYMTHSLDTLLLGDVEEIENWGIT